MERSWDVKDNRSYHRSALPGREACLSVRHGREGNPSVIRGNLVDLLKVALPYAGKVYSASIVDYRGKVVVTPRLMTMFWAAELGCFGTGSDTAPYTITGPTINPTFLEQYHSIDLFGALDFAVWWAGSDEDPYWIRLRGPNGRLIMSPKTVEGLYHSSFGAAGGSITVSLVRPSNNILVGDGVAIRLPEVLSSTRIV